MSKKRKVSTAYTERDKEALCYLFTLSMYMMESYSRGLAEAFNFSARQYFGRKAKNARAELKKFAGFAKGKGELNIWEQGEDIVLVRKEIMLQFANIALMLPGKDEDLEWLENEVEMLKFRAKNKFPKPEKTISTDA